MPIITQMTQVEETPQGSDGSHVVVRMFDQDNTQYMVSFFAQPGADIPALVSTRTAELNEQLAQQEFENIIGNA